MAYNLQTVKKHSGITIYRHFYWEVRHGSFSTLAVSHQLASARSYAVGHNQFFAIAAYGTLLTRMATRICKGFKAARRHYDPPYSRQGRVNPR